MPPEIVDQVQDEVVEDRRATIEAALDAAEQESTGSAAAPSGEVPAPTPAAPEKAAASTPAATDKPVPTPAPGPEDDTPTNVEKAPQSWRPAQKAKWAALDPEVRQEVMRREREITRTLGETAQARQIASQFHQMVQPYMARIQSAGATPLAAVQELFKADYILATSPPVTKAQYMAGLIKNYGIDVRELDNALAGTVTTDPVQSTVEKLVEQRLAPFQQYIAQQQAAARAQEQYQAHQTQTTIEQMAQDEKFPHFQDLRQDMADIIDLSAKRGVYLSLEQAYSRAVAMNPEISQALASQQAAEAKKAAALAGNARAQRALTASKSVGGAPVGSVSGLSDAKDRRSVLMAAFDSVEGR